MMNQFVDSDIKGSKISWDFVYRLLSLQNFPVTKVVYSYRGKSLFYVYLVI